MDSFGASEGLGFGRSITTAQGGTNTAKFAIGEFCDVFDENDRKVTPGSGVPGFIALMGAIPAGYYKDPVKSAKTFRTIDGVRYSIPGDWCMVEADGSLTLLGRGSEIGRASCREGVGKYVSISVVAVSFNKKRHRTRTRD